MALVNQTDSRQVTKTDALTARLNSSCSKVKKLAEVAGTYSIKSVLKAFKNGNYKALVLSVQQIHQTEGRSDRYTKAKKGLPAFTFGGTFKKKRANKNLLVSSGVVIGDLDKIGDRLEDYFKKLCNDPYILAVWKSPSGDGIKFLIAIPFVKDDEEYKSYLKAIENYFEQTYGIILTFGTEGADIARNCFVCYDPDLYIAESVEVFTETLPYYQEKPKAEIKPKSIPQGISQNGKYAEQALNACIDIITSSIPKTSTQRGNRHYSRRKAGILAGGYIAGGILNETKITPLLENAVSANTTLKTETAFKTVLDGIEWGKQYPITEEQKEAERRAWLKEKLGSYPENDRRKKPAAGGPSPGSDGKSYETETKGEGKEKSKTDGPGIFWEYVTVNAKGDLKLTINRSKFIEFLQANGFYKTELNDKDYIFVRVEKNVVTEVRPVHIKNFVKRYIRSLETPETPEIEAAILKGARQYFATDLIEFLDNIVIRFNRPDKKTAYRYYKNCVAKVTAEKGIETLEYSDLPGKVWKNQILDRDFKIVDFDNCEYERFINNVSNRKEQPERKDSFTSAIGYLLHGFKHKPLAKAVVCVDEKIPRNDNEANGGTGKGIFFNAIAELKNSVIKDGQTFKSDKTFLYQDVNLDTEILIIDDAKKNFPFHAVFSTITEDMPVEKKNRPLFIIPFEKSPKIIFTTNFTIKGRGVSYERRKFEIEFADFYNAKFTPFDEFKHTLFDDWSAEEWLRFDNFMLTCCWLYLKKGLIEYQRRNIAERTLIDDTHRDFVEYAEENLETGMHDRGKLYGEFREQYTDFNNDKFTKNTFRKWLSFYADFKNWHADFKRSNSKDYVTFTKKLPFLPELPANVPESNS